MKPQLTEISGIGPQTAEVLRDHGIKTVKALAKKSLDELAAVQGFGPLRARRVSAAAKEVLGRSKKRKKASSREERRKDKGKKGKKGKKSKKNRRGKKK